MFVLSKLQVEIFLVDNFIIQEFAGEDTQARHTGAPWAAGLTEVWDRTWQQPSGAVLWSRPTIGGGKFGGFFRRRWRFPQMEINTKETTTE